MQLTRSEKSGARAGCYVFRGPNAEFTTNFVVIKAVHE